MRPTTPAPAVLGGPAAFDREVFVTQPVVPDPQAYADLAASIFESRWLTNNGARTQEFERQLESYLGVSYCRTFCNGTAALLTALRALDLKGEVITTPFTFPATPHCIEWNNLTPVFCDVRSDSYNLDPIAVENAITPATSAILPVHVFGNPCDVAAFEDISQRYGIPIVYDAAHAFGVSLNDHPIGTYGSLSAFSFHATKVFHCAEGGAVVAADDSLASRLSLLRNFGIVDENTVSGVGLNGKLDELHAALGLLILEQINEEIARRGALVDRYYLHLDEVPGLAFQKMHPGTTPNNYNFTVEIDTEAFGLSRDEVHFALRSENIISRKYFYPLCSENDCYRHLPSSAWSNLPNATGLSNRVLSLPLYGALTSYEVDLIAQTLTSLSEHASDVKKAIRSL
jgi:dTDP-4-amino-4,6-dideoxygalactose transaminase